MWAFDVISIIQIFDDDSVMYGSSDRPVIDFIANASSKALDHGMSIATTALREARNRAYVVDQLKTQNNLVVEVLQNCVIFNDGTHNAVAKKEDRERNAIYLEHGKPMLFGPNKEFGLMQEGFGLKVVKLGENGVTEKDILVHDAHCEDHTLQLKLALMEGPDFPIALGVIRDVEAPTYDAAVEAQIEEVSAKKKYHTFAELLETNDTWEIK